MADLMLCSVIRGDLPSGLGTACVVEHSEYTERKSLASFEETLSSACSKYEGGGVADMTG
jgi:hypothetical protein